MPAGAGAMTAPARGVAARPAVPVRPAAKAAASGCFGAAMFMSIMDSTIVNVTLPTLGRQFGVPLPTTGLVVLAYLVSLGAFIPAAGWLADRFGARRLFLVALALFTAASAVCGMSATLGELVAARVAQGAGGGLLVPTATAMLYHCYPPAERVRAARVLQAPTALAPALGPVLGGLLVVTSSWRLAFFVNVPIGLAVLVLGRLALPEYRDRAAGRFDVAGFALGGTGLGLAMFALAQGTSAGWGSPTVPGAGAAAVVLLAALVVVELRAEYPMVNLRLFGNRLFRWVNVAFLSAQCAFLGSLYLAPLLLQNLRGVSPLTSGLTTFEEAVGITVATQLVARTYPRWGPRRIMAGGLVGIAAVLALLCLLAGQAPLWLFGALMFALGAGMGHVWLPAQTAALATIRPVDTGRASTLLSAQRQLGAAVGVAIASTALMPGRGGPATVELTAFRHAFLLLVVVAVVGAGFALLVDDRDAAPTMRRPAKEGEACAST
jgi:EmrB/QacA subfamily drug resistance transporter